MTTWNLPQRFRFDGDEAAYAVFGDGPPVVLVHGYPGNSYAWREVAPALARSHRVHVFDMLGFGRSTKREGQEVFGVTQARLLAALFDEWKLDAPAVVAHDIGAAVALGAYLFERRPFRRLALLSAAVLNPCVSANSMHVRAHLAAYQTMPAKLYEEIMRAHIPTTMHTGMDDETFEAYFGPWRGAEGQAAYFRFLGQFDESYLDHIEENLSSVEIPVLILWGEEDTWIPLARGQKLKTLMPDAELETFPKAGHFLMDDAPEVVTRSLAAFVDAKR